jgi:hypothetical protein
MAAFAARELSFVIGVASPPLAETRAIGPWLLEANTITPLVDHAPPRASGASHKTTGEPESMAILRSLPDEKKPTVRLSGDQNGSDPLSVPGSTRALIARQRADVDMARTAAVDGNERHHAAIGRKAPSPKAKRGWYPGALPC